MTSRNPHAKQQQIVGRLWAVFTYEILIPSRLMAQTKGMNVLMARGKPGSVGVIPARRSRFNIIAVNGGFSRAGGVLVGSRNAVIRGVPKFELHARLRVARKRRAWYSRDRGKAESPDHGAIAEMIGELRAESPGGPEHQHQMALVA